MHFLTKLSLDILFGASIGKTIEFPYMYVYVYIGEEKRVWSEVIALPVIRASQLLAHFHSPPREKRKGIDRIALHKLEHFHPVASCRNLGRFHPPPSIGALRLSRSRWKIFTRVSFRSRGVKNCLPPAFLPRKQN